MGQIERQVIVHYIAGAAFNRNDVTTEEQIRGLTYLGRTVLPWDDSLFVHLVRRVLVQRQWPVGTTEAEYVNDPRDAVIDRDAEIRLGLAGGLPTVQIEAPTSTPPTRRGVGSQAWTVVIYAPNRGALVPGYQARRPPHFPDSWRL